MKDWNKTGRGVMGCRVWGYSFSLKNRNQDRPHWVSDWESEELKEGALGIPRIHAVGKVTATS